MKRRVKIQFRYFLIWTGIFVSKWEFERRYYNDRWKKREDFFHHFFELPYCAFLIGLRVYFTKPTYPRLDTPQNPSEEPPKRTVGSRKRAGLPRRGKVRARPTRG